MAGSRIRLEGEIEIDSFKIVWNQLNMLREALNSSVNAELIVPIIENKYIEPQHLITTMPIIHQMQQQQIGENLARIEQQGGFFASDFRVDHIEEQDPEEPQQVVNVFFSFTSPQITEMNRLIWDICYSDITKQQWYFNNLERYKADIYMELYEHLLTDQAVKLLTDFKVNTLLKLKIIMEKGLN